MRELVQKIRDELMATEDTVCLQRALLATEAYQLYENDPPPLKRAKTFSHILHNMDLDLETNPIFAGNTSSRPRAWMLVPEHGMNNDTQVIIENESLKDILDGQIPQDLQDYWKDKSFGGCCGIGHLAVDLQKIVHEGLESMIAEAQQYRDESDPDKRIYREAMVIALQAVVHWANRYAEAAEKAANSTEDNILRAAHQRVAEACRRVPARPARNLFEGLQAKALVHLAIAIEGHGMSISVGLSDRALAPFIDHDFDPEYATNLIGAFMLKIAANSLFGRGSKTQAITVGGINHLGEDQCNAVTLCFLEACNRIRVGDPHVFLRWHDYIDPEVKEKAVEMLADGVSMPLLINDPPTAQGFINAGVADEDAWEYCVIGCNELGIPGRSAESATATAGNIQYLGLLNQTLLEYPDPDSIEDMPQLMDSLEKTMARRLSEMRKWGTQNRKRTAEQMPTPFTSALMRGCIKRGQDMLIGMEYHLPGIYERGLTNAANALVAIQQVVFDEKYISMSELIREMQNNFRNAPVRAQLLAAPKWGNNDESVDHWATELVAMRERILNDIDTQFGHYPHMVCHVVRSLHHVDGKRIAASPDGRYAWTPVADSIGAQTGTALVGPTAVLNSVLKLDAANNYRGGYNLNLTLSKSTATPETIMTLVETFFGEGGQEMQINCFDVDILRAARENPEEYGDLIVRVAGFSTRFVDLSTAEQEELIQRAEANEN
jgi:formate C-acetyltransferase